MNDHWMLMITEYPVRNHAAWSSINTGYWMKPVSNNVEIPAE